MFTGLENKEFYQVREIRKESGNLMEKIRNLRYLKTYNLKIYQRCPCSQTVSQACFWVLCCKSLAEWWIELYLSMRNGKFNWSHDKYLKKKCSHVSFICSGIDAKNCLFLVPYLPVVDVEILIFMVQENLGKSGYFFTLSL